ncbi:MAG: VWA domain-containing protein [Anaerolineae bacterium]|nr:VWA domain-containing protein [Anaerolineae bacterium]
MRFATPIALLLLLLLPFVIALGYPRVAYRRRRDLTSLILRIVIILLLVFGLAGLQTVRAADKLSVVFLVDASDSIDSEMRAQADAYIRDAMSSMTPEDRAGIVVFGKNALVERPISSVKDAGVLTSVPVRLDTDIAEALRLGMAMFPADTARRIVLLSDGAETTGNAAEAAKLAAAMGVQIDVVPLQRGAGPEVIVSSVNAPGTVNEGEIFDVDITIESQVATSATITILSGGSVVYTDVISLKAGQNTFTIPLRAPKQGFNDLQVRVDPATAGADTFYQNNSLATFTEVTGPPRVLMVTENPDEIAALLPVLQNTGIQVDVMAPNDLPIGIAPLAAYKAVVLANVSATNLTDSRMRALQTYVRDLGGGLIVIGGPNSYGVGGYYQTPLEEVLPVDMQIKDQKRIPSLTMIYVIDRSGSMEVIGSSGVTNLELSKEAARRSVNFLFERDQAGVLSFDSNPEWIVPIQPVSNRASVISQIGRLRPGGGTDIFAAIREIARTAPSIQTTLKHVIMLTDGGADPYGIIETVRSLHDQYGVTVTSIGVGADVPAFMKDIATYGGGTYYNLRDLATIPQIFAAETVLATRSYIEEKEFVPNLTANSQIMKGITALPSLLGYVATTPKDTATVVLTAPGFNDPILATWQYGLGRAVAFTSDATARWGRNWTSWENFQRFWSQVIRSTIVEGLNNALETHIEERNGKTYLVVEARKDTGEYINGMTLDASVVDPRLNASGVELKQVAPGRYEAEIEPQTEGAYFIRVAGSSGGETSGAAQTTGWVLSYSPEYRLRDVNTDLLNEVTELTGGRIVTGKPELAFVHDLHAEQASLSLWPFLLLAAVLLLPIDIGVRRVVVTQSDIQKFTAWARQKLKIKPRENVAEVVSERITVLQGAKKRATQAMPAPNLPADEQAAVNAPLGAARTSRVPTAPISRVEPTTSAAPPPPVYNPPPKPAGTDSGDGDDGSGSLAARLKAKKKRE